MPYNRVDHIQLHLNGEQAFLDGCTFKNKDAIFTYLFTPVGSRHTLSEQLLNANDGNNSEEELFKHISLAENCELK